VELWVLPFQLGESAIKKLQIQTCSPSASLMGGGKVDEETRNFEVIFLNRIQIQYFDK